MKNIRLLILSLLILLLSYATLYEKVQLNLWLLPMVTTLQTQKTLETKSPF